MLGSSHVTEGRLIVGITRAHEDIMFARNGDAAALYRVRMRARANPDEHDRLRAELAIALRERWRNNFWAFALEGFIFKSADVDPLLIIDVTSP